MSLTHLCLVFPNFLSLYLGFVNWPRYLNVMHPTYDHQHHLLTPHDNLCTSIGSKIWFSELWESKLTTKFMLEKSSTCVLNVCLWLMIIPCTFWPTHHPPVNIPHAHPSSEFCIHSRFPSDYRTNCDYYFMALLPSYDNDGTWSGN